MLISEQISFIVYRLALRPVRIRSDPATFLASPRPRQQATYPVPTAKTTTDLLLSNHLPPQLPQQALFIPFHPPGGWES